MNNHTSYRGGIRLARRPQQVLDALLNGASEKQIALELGISRHTVHTYVKQLHMRFAADSRGELLAVVYRQIIAYLLADALPATESAHLVVEQALETQNPAAVDTLPLEKAEQSPPVAEHPPLIEEILTAEDVSVPEEYSPLQETGSLKERFRVRKAWLADELPPDQEALPVDEPSITDSPRLPASLRRRREKMCLPSNHPWLI